MMRIGLIGRTNLLLRTGILLNDNGFEIAFIVTSKEAPEYDASSEDFKKFAKSLDIPFMHDPAITYDKLISLINGEDVPLAISINYSGVIPEDVTSLFKLGILNAHGGDLPRYRGNACQAWAIINGEKNIGLCIHRMVGGELDSGDILLKKIYPININTRIGEVYDWFDLDIPQMFLETVDLLEDNPAYILETQSKHPKDALRCYPRMPEDGKIDWSDTAENIVRLVNASSEPYSGAFCFDAKGEVIKIWRAEIFEDDENWCGIPGQVAKILTDETILVLTGKGKVKISLVEYQNNLQRPARFIKSIRNRFH